METHGASSDPYRIFFPFGIALGAAGVSIWPLYYYGLTEGYSGRAHAFVQTDGFPICVHRRVSPDGDSPLHGDRTFWGFYLVKLLRTAPK